MELKWEQLIYGDGISPDPGNLFLGVNRYRGKEERAMVIKFIIYFLLAAIGLLVLLSFSLLFFAH